MSDGHRVQLNDDTTLYIAKSGAIVIIQDGDAVALNRHDVLVLIAWIKQAQAYAESEMQK